MYRIKFSIQLGRSPLGEIRLICEGSVLKSCCWFFSRDSILVSPTLISPHKCQNELQDILSESPNLATLIASDFCSFGCHLDIWESFFLSYFQHSLTKQYLTFPTFNVSHTRLFCLCNVFQNAESYRVCLFFFNFLYQSHKTVSSLCLS